MRRLLSISPTPDTSPGPKFWSSSRQGDQHPSNISQSCRVTCQGDHGSGSRDHGCGSWSRDYGCGSRSRDYGCGSRSRDQGAWFRVMWSREATLCHVIRVAFPGHVIRGITVPEQIPGIQPDPLPSFLFFNINNTQKDMKMLNSKNLAISSFKTQILLAFKNLNING